jgi:phosphate uptake regulator
MFDAGDTCTNPIEGFIRKTYEEQIKRKPTFDENMQEHIKRELERLKQEAIEYNKNKKKD